MITKYCIPVPTTAVQVREKDQSHTRLLTTHFFIFYQLMAFQHNNNNDKNEKKKRVNTNTKHTINNLHFTTTYNKRK